MTAIRAFLLGAAMLAGCLAPTGDALATTKGARLGAPGEDLIVGSWALYASRFVQADGRVVDDANGDISHSEGQGYGMLIAVAADDRPAFERMLGWTDKELMVRGDGLAAWRWEPGASPHVTDHNNATDGDLLIAWALLRASKRWDVPEWRDRAAAIAGAVMKETAAPSAVGTVLLPGAEGFGEASQPDGPVMNLSYWIFPALEELATVSPALEEAKLADTGHRLVGEARFGQAGLPADWTALGAERPAPAVQFPPQFGYNAVRVPLYLAWSAKPDKTVLAAFVDALSPANGGVRVVDLSTGQTVEPMADPGFRAAIEVADCALGRSPRATVAPAFEPTRYYPSTLHILALMALAERYPQCLR